MLRESLDRLCSKIRNLINESRKKNLLRKNEQLWHKLCSSLDVIQDTDAAMTAYQKNAFPKDEGEQYIRVYGILQALVVQQDATKHLIESLQVGMAREKKDEALRVIRDIRNRSTGHPTEKTHGGVSYNFISRVTMHKEGYRLMSIPKGGEPEFIDVSIPKLIDQQREAIERMLGEVFEDVKREESAHKEAFKDEKLQDIFARNIHSFAGKVWESIHTNTIPACVGMTHLEFLEKALEEFKEALKKRDLWEAYEPITHIYRSLEYPIDQVKNYLKGQNQSINAKKNATVNFYYIDEHIKELEQIAGEIDEDYGTVTE